MDREERQRLKKLNTMRECLNGAEHYLKEDNDIAAYKNKIISRFKERCIPIDEKEIEQFVRDYGVTVPTMASDICVFCNHQHNRVSTKVMDAFPAGIPVCAPCYLKRS